MTLGAAAGALFYVAFACWNGLPSVTNALAAFSLTSAVAALALASLNYLLRFFKWELYLRQLGVRIPAGESLGIFLSGFSLTVTPGKVGEVLKAYLLREAHGIPMARTAPTIVAERLTDLVALAALALSGVSALGANTRVVWIALGLVALALSWLSSERLSLATIELVARLPLGKRAAPATRVLSGHRGSVTSGAARRRDAAVRRRVVVRVPGFLAGAARFSRHLCVVIAVYVHLLDDDHRRGAVLPARRARRRRSAWSSCW